MKMRRMPQIREGGVNVTPLIDIVMCLIIFFMLVAKIGVDSGADKTIVLPPALLSANIQDMGNTLTLNVTDGPPVVGRDVEPTVTCLLKGQHTELKIHDENGHTPLYDALHYLKEGDASQSVTGNPNFKVIIRADEGTSYQYLQPVLSECSRAHVDYDFATREGAPAQ